MSAVMICDGCGKQEKAIEVNGDYVKPRDWFQRSDKEGIQLVCSRECIKAISDKTGKTSVVLPI